VQETLNAVAKLSGHAPGYRAALGELMATLHRSAIAQALPEAVDNSQGDRQQIYAFAHAISAADVQLYYQTALLGRRDLPLVPDQRSGVESVLERMLAFKPQAVNHLPKASLSATSADKAKTTVSGGDARNSESNNAQASAAVAPRAESAESTESTESVDHTESAEIHDSATMTNETPVPNQSEAEEKLPEAPQETASISPEDEYFASAIDENTTDAGEPSVKKSDAVADAAEETVEAVGDILRNIYDEKRENEAAIAPNTSSSNAASLKTASPKSVPTIS